MNDILIRGGLLYDGTTFALGYNGLIIEEWKAAGWNPSSGKCAGSDPKFSWNCAPLLTTPGGHVLYAAPSGGLAGYPPDLADIYFELGTTELNMKGATGHVPTRQDVAMMADAFKPTKAADAVRLNQKARDYTALLQRTAASRIDFKTYLPGQDILGFTVDKRGFENAVDPLHPYLYLHFGRVAQGNVAAEFSAYEFKDPLPLSATHCGADNPELRLGLPCKAWFTSAKGVAVYTTYDSTRFDLPRTRVVLGLSPDIIQVSQSTMSQFVDSFSEVPPQSI